MIDLKTRLVEAIKLYNEGSDNEEYFRGQVELAMHLLDAGWDDKEIVLELIGWREDGKNS